MWDHRTALMLKGTLNFNPNQTSHDLVHVAADRLLGEFVLPLDSSATTTLSSFIEFVEKKSKEDPQKVYPPTSILSQVLGMLQYCDITCDTIWYEAPHPEETFNFILDSIQRIKSGRNQTEDLYIVIPIHQPFLDRLIIVMDTVPERFVGRLAPPPRDSINDTTNIVDSVLTRLPHSEWRDPTSGEVINREGLISSLNRACALSFEEIDGIGFLFLREIQAEYPDSTASDDEPNLG